MPPLLRRAAVSENLDDAFMKTFLIAICLAVLAGCATHKPVSYWRVKDMVLGQATQVELQKQNSQVAATIPTRTLQEIMLAHLRISRSAHIEAELLIVDEKEPNAFAGFVNDRAAIGITLGMIQLVGTDVNQYAGLLGHEAGHWAKGHIDASQMRSNTLQVIGTIVSAGLSVAGVPASGLITGVGLDLIDASFSRDQEREADAASIDYVLANNYNPQAMITLFAKLMEASNGFQLPFLSSHPSDAERIENFKALIEAKKATNRATGE